MKLKGIYLPIITPFSDEKIDFESYEKLIVLYLSKGISGLIPLGTTGENQTIELREYEELVERTIQIVNKKVPVFVGAGGSNTKKVIELAKLAESYGAQGILSVTPYYNCPGQKGIFYHFTKIAESTSLPIIIYNIPHRTGINISNETIFKLTENKNIIGVKDCCGNIRQSLQLLADRPEYFSVLTGDDFFFYSALANGADGGILASAHIGTEVFLSITKAIEKNDHKKANALFKTLMPMIGLLFEEPNPAPLKYLMYRMSLIHSPETRLPLTAISDELKEKLNQWISLEREMIVNI